MENCPTLRMINPLESKRVHLIGKAENLEEQLMAAGDKLVVIGLFATWCLPCTILGPMFEEISRKFGDQMVALKIDVDESPELAEKFTICELPTFVFYRKGLHLDTLTGVENDEKLKQLIENELYWSQE